METYGENVGEDEQYEIEILLAMKSNDDIDEYIKKKMAADFQTISPPIVVEQQQPEPEMTPKPSQAEINANAASYIGKMAADRVHNRAYTSAYEQQRAQKQLVTKEWLYKLMQVFAIQQVQLQQNLCQELTQLLLLEDLLISVPQYLLNY